MPFPFTPGHSTYVGPGCEACSKLPHTMALRQANAYDINTAYGTLQSKWTQKTLILYLAQINTRKPSCLSH